MNDLNQITSLVIGIITSLIIILFWLTVLDRLTRIAKATEETNRILGLMQHEQNKARRQQPPEEMSQT